MKKVSLLLITIILVIPFLSVKAAVTPKVLTLDATTNGTTISYNGTIEDGSSAVMCKLYKGDEELDLLSSAVEDNNFSGSFTVTTKTTYKVACANYEGGDFKELTVSLSDDTETTTGTTSDNNKSTNVKNVKTSDNIIKFMILAGISLITIVTLFVIKKKRA